jgi:hypothetical protein
MRTGLKLTLLPLVAIAALAAAENAFATQRIAVSQTPSSLTIHLTQDQSDAQPAKITIYVPASYGFTATGNAGDKIGTTSGQVFARDLRIPLPLSGDVLVANQAALPPAEVAACSPGTHDAVWILHLTVAGQAIDLPVFVSRTSATDASGRAVA